MNKLERAKYLKENIYPKLEKEYIENINISLVDFCKDHDISYPSFYKYLSQKGVNTTRRIMPPRKDYLSKDIIKDYLESEYVSLRQLSEKYNIAENTISNMLKRHGYTPHNNRKIKGLEEKIELGIKIYITTELNTIEAAKKAGIGKNRLREELKKRNLLKKEIHIQKDITFDKSFFKDLDTEEKAYWFGFIYADGSISNGRLTIEISKSDENMLDKFKTSISCNINTKYRSRKLKSDNVSNVCSISLSSIQLCSDLESKGCIPNKTYDGKIKYEFKNNKLKAAFLRGYIDGDGYISKPENSTHILKINVKNHNVANYIFKAILELSSFKVIPIFKYESEPNGGAYRISIQNKKDFFTILELIYNDATIYMDRKYKNYIFKLAALSGNTQSDKSGIKREG